MNKPELKELTEYLDKVSDVIPNGLWPLKDAVIFAAVEIKMYIRFDKKGDTYNKALTFAKSIPKDDDLKSDKIINWQLNDREYLKYMP